MRMPKSLLWIFAGLLTAKAVAAQEVVINEFMASNGSGYVDEDGEFSDWIELHNTTALPVTLDNWSLTDDPENLRKWRFVSISIPANGYLVVHASGKNRVSGSRLHSNFSLSIDGEYLALVRADGTVAHDFDPQFPQQFRDTSYGYNPTGAEFVYFTTATPGAANSAGMEGFVEDTKFSHDRGFYTNAFNLTITTATAGATIRYSTNGAPPTATTGLIYTGPVRISGTTTLQASAFRAGFRPSNIDTHTYIFLDDVIRQSPTGAPPPGWPSSWGANTVDYGMDPAVVNNPVYRDTIKNDLKTLPSFSIVMRLGDMFDPRTGIYANPGQDGRDWERQCSLELINPDGNEGFQVNAGIRIRGGFSRDTGNPKHALRFFFRSEYGDSKLIYPLHGEGAADVFDALDLRTFQNYSWSFQGDANGVFLRDQFSRDTQLAMGHNAERGNFYHLYINGQYWGIYNTCERPEASYGETYFGGAEDDYDVIKVEAGAYTINATDGNMTAWNSLYNMARAGFASNEAYQKVQGNNPDGTPNPNFPVLLDIPNLIDYMLVIYYSGNLDAPISAFLGNSSPNNWYGMRNRNINARMGFKFFAHDSEHTLLPWDASVDRTGPFSSGDTSVSKSNPQWIFQKLWANPEFRMKAADHIHRHFFNNGVLTVAKSRERFLARKNEIDRAVVAESARWGDAKRSAPMTRNTEWVNAINSVLNGFFPQRSTTVLNQLRAKNLYPTVPAPSFNQHGGNVQPGFTLSVTAPNGVIYYTLDGSDPRLPGGAISPSALPYSGGFALNESLTVKSRALSGATWSALNEADFTIIRTFKDLIITEVMYNPTGLGLVDPQEFEFIELKNISPVSLDLSGVQFTNGITYTFARGTVTPPGEFVILVKNLEAFQSKYPGVRVDGTYEGQLSNSGENLALAHAAGSQIFRFAYSDVAPWPISADGAGFSLVPVRYDAALDLSNATSWRASSKAGGSPGRDDVPANITPVYINELIAHSDSPEVDAIELYNPGTTEADIGNWHLSDDSANPKKYRIAAGTKLQAGGYLVVTEAQFNADPSAPGSFRFNSHGDDAYLFSANETGDLTGFVDGFSFGASANGISFGRYTNSVGEVSYPAQTAVTLGQANSGPIIGPVVISEIQYAPEAGGVEFIEIRNITSGSIKLYDPSAETNRWRINGVGFAFPERFELPPQGIALIVAGSTEAFRTSHSIPANVPVLGPFEGNLQNSGEMLQLLRPDAPETGTDGTVFVPYIVADAVRYNDKTPWPNLGINIGSSLEKLPVNAYGNDPGNWRASPGPASPGLDNDGNRPPIITIGADQSVVSATFPVAVSLTGSAMDDGQPHNPGAMSYSWKQVSGPGTVLFANPASATSEALLPGVGTYQIQLTVSDGQLDANKTMSVTVSRPQAEATLISSSARWKYFEGATDPDPLWKTAGFNDAAWKEGAAQLGYGDGDESTVVEYGPHSGDKYPTTYFRYKFNLTNPGSVTRLTGRLLRDDGAIVYINGVEVFRSNMPENNVNYRTYASNVVGDSEESAFFDRDIDTAVLVQGQNVVAVEVHQANAGSTDLSFNFELIALTNPFNQPPQANAGPDQSITLPGIATLNGVASDDALPNPPGVFTVTWSQSSGPGTATFASPSAQNGTVSFSAAGVYVLKMSVTDGELTAQDEVTITVTGAADLYASWKAEHFNASELGNPSISGDTADPDGDTVQNKDEFTAGTDPRDGSSFLHVQAITSDQGKAVLVFDAAAEKSYSIQAREALGEGAWESILDLSPQAESAELIIRDPITPEKVKKFYRVVTPQQRQP
ncbi:MAG: lamin tail domain-containing protein [Verrucomicrobiales bacterium]